MSQLNLNDVRSEALFVSALQPSDRPAAAQVRVAITQTIRQFGTRGCAARMAQEYGDAPETAIPRMRWARQVVADIFAGRPAPAPRPAAALQLAAA
ncbi:MAG TPA: hypothetical protein VFR67_05360 [Pilimelia sp.]|nr:hypothetical protein [Pilimelia sp.]